MTKFYESPCTFPEVSNTEAIQTLSLMRFAGAMGYEPVYDKMGKLLHFSNPRFRKQGCEKFKVNTMIHMHNKAPDMALHNIAGIEFFGHIPEFKEFVNDDNGEADILVLFAGYCRIVTKVKATYHKYRGLEFQSQKVEFQTKLDYNQYKHLIG
ncbi:hypothetical protein PMW_93 [Pseudomonas phage phiPMW]|uniref:DUF7390 domain-containing protein n=1 Tax=Pseudomonas phage phiPMW TaxID=1815582 RepID=A0A1S5R1G2_9CAUD|nr:hypothetical protein FDG97_gp093 [Pseudomonas phage phiPMW]ANA49218.1 hypothetical protein PMW_93 [Pseudomonas phage phiPMW]